jgi:DNA transformation protein
MNRYVEFVMEQFAPLGTITARSMFGGYTLYCEGIPFALIASEAVYLKVDDQNHAQFEVRGLQAFKPYADKPGVMQYFQIPPEIFEDDQALRAWGGPAIEAGWRALAKKKPKNIR